MSRLVNECPKRWEIIKLTTLWNTPRLKEKRKSIRARIAPEPDRRMTNGIINVGKAVKVPSIKASTNKKIDTPNPNFLNKDVP